MNPAYFNEEFENFDEKCTQANISFDETFPKQANYNTERNLEELMEDSCFDENMNNQNLISGDQDNLENLEYVRENLMSDDVIPVGDKIRFVKKFYLILN